MALSGKQATTWPRVSGITPRPEPRESPDRVLASKGGALSENVIANGGNCSFSNAANAEGKAGQSRCVMVCTLD